MNENTDIIERIEAFCRASGIKESTFGFRAVNDGKLVARLREGKTITMPKWRQIEQYLLSGKEAAH